MPARRPVVGQCPVCGGAFHVTELACSDCGSSLHGRFELCRFCRLTREQREFVELFIVARGNIKEVERILGISYPTVRNRLEQIIEALGHSGDRKEAALSGARRQEILEALDRGEISADEAAKQLRNL